MKSINDTVDYIEKQPLVSVVMATYNDKPSFIHSALTSIINQTYENFELLIIDDSTDIETKTAIDSYKFDTRVHIYRENNKIGFVPSLNKGLRLAKGDYIARMDGDDISDLNRFKIQVEYLDTHPLTDILGGQINIIDEDDNVTGFRSYPVGGVKLFSFFLIRSPVAHPAVMFRRKIVTAGFMYDESLKKAEDLDFWIRLYNAGYRFNNLENPILNFRVCPDFLEKRVMNHEQEFYVLNIRRNNFTWKRPVFSLLNLFIAIVRTFVPDILKIKLYEKENGMKPRGKKK